MILYLLIFGSPTAHSFLILQAGVYLSVLVGLCFLFILAPTLISCPLVQGILQVVSLLCIFSVWCFWFSLLFQFVTTCRTHVLWLISVHFSKYNSKGFWWHYNCYVYPTYVVTTLTGLFIYLVYIMRHTRRTTPYMYSVLSMVRGPGPTN